MVGTASANARNRRETSVLALVASAFALAGAASAQVPPATSCASTASAGQLGPEASGWIGRLYCGTGGCLAVTRGTVPAISADGRFVVFPSDRTDLVSPPTASGIANVFRKDLDSGAVVLVSAAPSGAAGNGDSGFSPIDPNESAALSVSADGRFVVFTSEATDLVASADLNTFSDVFLRDVAASTTTRLSSTPAGIAGAGASFGPRITSDGRYVAFYSTAFDLVPNDVNVASDVFLFDRASSLLQRVSLAVDGGNANGASFDASLSDDGRFVAYASYASNIAGPAPNGLSNVFLYDRWLGTTRRVSLAPGGGSCDFNSGWPRLSSDGRYLAFHSAATNLVQPPDPQIQFEVYRYDRLAAANTRLTFTSGGAPGVGAVYSPSISGDGRYVAFHTRSDTLVAGDTNARSDAFVVDATSGAYERLSVSTAGGQAADGGTFPALSADGRRAAWVSTSGDLVPGDVNVAFDVFVRDRGFGGAPAVYCVAAANSLQCLPSLTSTGTASASAGSGFTVRSANLLNQRSGLFYYGTAGPTAVAFGTGMMCVRSPRIRTAVQSTGGSALPANDCSGALAIDFNAVVALGLDPGLVAGAEVWLQGWSRDSASPSKTHLTQALHFQLGP
jgi:Tol biopolymer transport system component